MPFFFQREALLLARARNTGVASNQQGKRRKEKNIKRKKRVKSLRRKKMHLRKD